MRRCQLVMLVAFSSGNTVFRMRAETPYGSSAANWPSRYSSSGLMCEMITKRLIDLEAKSRQRNIGPAGQGEFHAAGMVAKLATPNQECV